MLQLIEQRTQTLSHERIADEVWGRKMMATKHVAHAVMDARRHIGDDPEAPAVILSVRGIGHRFAAACLRHGDVEEAGRLADRAIVTADLAGAHPELARGLALAAVVMLRVGTHEQALALTTRAMRLAQRDGRSPLIAETRLALVRTRRGPGPGARSRDPRDARAPGQGWRRCTT